MSISPRLRVAALAGVAAVLALAAGFFLLGRGDSQSSAAVKTIKPLHPVKKRAVRPAVQRRPSPATKRVAAMARRSATPKVPAVENGLPAPLAAALARHPVVVAALYQPKSSVDEMAEAEARVGAANAGAGYVAISVFNNAYVRALTNLLGSEQDGIDRLLDAPAVLIFTRPKTLFVRFNGYSDAETIQQAAANAVPAGTLDAADTGASWITRADATCTRMSQQLSLFAASYLRSPTDASTVVNRVLAILDSTVAELTNLPAPRPLRGEAHAMTAQFRAVVDTLREALAAARAGHRAEAQRLTEEAQSHAARGQATAARLGATSCT